MFGRKVIILSVTLVSILLFWGVISSQSTVNQITEVADLQNVAVRTIEDLKRLPVQASKGVIFVAGYHSVGDGGGGTFVWNPSMIKDDNGGTIIKPNSYSGPGRWVRSYSGPVYPEWFGAKKDGSDDTTSVMRALNVGGELVFQEGKYTLSSINIVKSNLIIRGAGGSKTILDFKNATGGSGLSISYSRSAGGSKNIFISDLTISDTRSRSKCENLIKIESGNIGQTPSQTSCFIDLQRVAIGSYNNPDGTAMLVRNISHLSLRQFNTAYQMKSAYGLVIDNNIDINTGVITVDNCYLQAMKTALIIKQHLNLLDSFVISNCFLANFENEAAREVVKFVGAISSVVFVGNHLEGRSISSPVVTASGLLAASTFRGNHFSCGTATHRATNVFGFRTLKLSACSFEDNEILRLNDNGSIFHIDASCELDPNEPVSIKRFWRNSTKARILPNDLSSMHIRSIQRD